MRPSRHGQRLVDATPHHLPPRRGACGAQPGPGPFDWRDRAVWVRAGKNTNWCLFGCSLGEFATLAAFDLAGVDAASGVGLEYYYPLLLLPLLNGLATSVALETVLLQRRSGLAFKPALETALGMS